MPDVTTDGVRIHYEVEGNGPALIVQHGFLGSPADWRTTGYLDALTDRYQLILIDARGHGHSDKPHDASRYTYEEMARDVVAVLDACEVERAHFWGYSMGGCIGYRLGRVAPDRIRSLVLGGAQPFPVSEADLVEELGEIQMDLRQGMDAFVAGFERRNGPLPRNQRMRWLTHFDGLALAACLDGQLADDRAGMPEPFDDLAMPCLLYAGTADALAREVPRAAATLPNATAVLFGGFGHIEAFETRAIMAYVRAFLDLVGDH